MAIAIVSHLLREKSSPVPTLHPRLAGGVCPVELRQGPCILDALTHRVTKVPKGCAEGLCHFWHCLRQGPCRMLSVRECEAHLSRGSASLLPRESVPSLLTSPVQGCIQIRPSYSEHSQLEVVDPRSAIGISDIYAFCACAIRPTIPARRPAQRDRQKRDAVIAGDGARRPGCRSDLRSSSSALFLAIELDPACYMRLMASV